MMDLSGIDERYIYAYAYDKVKYAYQRLTHTYDAASRALTFDVESAHMTPGGDLTLYIWAREDQAAGRWGFSYIHLTVEDDPTLDTTPPDLAITSPHNNEQVEITDVYFEGTATDDSGIQEIKGSVYDYLRKRFTVSNQVLNYNETTNTWNLEVDETHVSAGGRALFLVAALDNAGNWASSQYIFIDVLAPMNEEIDTLPPVVRITEPVLNSTSAASRLMFKGTAEDMTGISEVRVYVYDYGRRGSSKWTVRNQRAQFNASTNMWEFDVQASHVTPGSKARFWVRAKDPDSRWSSWQYRQVTIDQS
jgi:hypothetical protein